MKNKVFYRLLSVMMTIVMVTVSIPMNAFATMMDEEGEIVSEVIEETESSIASEEMVGEILEKRESNTKYFRMSDGSITAAVYPYDIHYDNGGEDLEEIDNSSISVSDDEDEAYGNKSNSFSAKFMKKSNQNKLYTLTYGENKIKVSIEGVEKVDVSIPEKEVIESEDNAYAVENISSKYIYEDILENIDLQYIVVSNMIKENIIIKDNVDIGSIKYIYHLNGETEATLMDEKTIIIREKESGDVVTYIEAPAMWDSSSRISQVLRTMTRGI